MRKLILSGMALAMLAVPAAASADVARTPVPTTTTTTTKVKTAATFTTWQPAGQVGQWDNVFRTDMSVTLGTDQHTFAGTAKVLGTDPNGTLDYSVAVDGKFSDDYTRVTYTVHPRELDGLSGFVTDALMDAPSKDAGTVSFAKVDDPSVDWALEVRHSAPMFTEIDKTETATTYTDMNHGQYVSSVGGGADAGKSNFGMPITAKKSK